MILTISFQLENVPFSIKSYRFVSNNCNGCSLTIMTHLLLLSIGKRLTQENRFLFRNMYGLFHGFIFVTIKKFLLSYFPNFHCQRSGGQNLGISYLKQSCFSHREGLVKDMAFHEKENLDKNRKA